MKGAVQRSVMPSWDPSSLGPKACGECCFAEFGMETTANNLALYKSLQFSAQQKLSRKDSVVSCLASFMPKLLLRHVFIWDVH